MVFLVQDFVFKTGLPRYSNFHHVCSQGVLVIIPVKTTLSAEGFKLFTIKEINPKFYFYITQHVFNDDVVTTDWNPW